MSPTWINDPDLCLRLPRAKDLVKSGVYQWVWLHLTPTPGVMCSLLGVSNTNEPKVVVGPTLWIPQC